MRNPRALLRFVGLVGLRVAIRAAPRYHPLHAAAGYYDGLDAMLSFHPFYMLPLCNTVRWDTHCGAAFSMIFRFVSGSVTDLMSAPSPSLGS